MVAFGLDRFGRNRGLLQGAYKIVGTSEAKSSKVVLPGELAVAVFFRLGQAGQTRFSQNRLAIHFDLAGNRWREIWSHFRKKRLGGAEFDGVVVSLLSGGSLTRDSGFETLYSTPHTLGSYGRNLYEELPGVLRNQVDQFVDSVVCDQEKTCR